MDGQAILTVSAAVVALTQIVKWGGLQDKHGPLVVLALAAVGVMFWGYSEGTFARTQSFAYFAGWISVSTSAAGVFGFTRAAPGAITKTSSPPSGAGASPTTTEERRSGD